MRLLIQVVNNADIKTDGHHERIGKGLLIYIGIHKNDINNYQTKLDKICLKLSTLKFFDKEGKINFNINDIGGEILLVSNFSLYGNNNKGTKIDFGDSANYKDAEIIYNKLIKNLKDKGYKIKTGVFGAYMYIQSENAGPLNYIFDF